MINLFFVIHDYSGARTYANELLGYLSLQKGILLHKIYLESKHYKEYTTVEKKGILEIHIPPVKIKRNSLEKYAKRCIDLIVPVVAGKKNLIFHLNYATQVKFGEEARKRFGAKLVYTLQHLPNYYSYLEVDDNIRQEHTTTGDVLEKEIIKEADIIVCITKFARNTICKQYNAPIEKTEVIYNGHGTIESKPSENIAWIRKSFGFGKNEQLILFAGRLGAEKGVPALINVFKRVVLNFSNVRLVLAGEGNFKEIMELCYDVAGKVTFTGSLKKEQLQKLYSIADIGVAPSSWELFGYTPVEMMHYRIPVVISNVPGMNELVKDGKNGLVCEVRKKTNGELGLEVDEADLYIKIKTLLENKTLARQLARNGRLNWGNNYTASHMGKETLNLYKQTLKQNFVQTLHATTQQFDNF